MIIAMLDMSMPSGHESETLRLLRACWESTNALPGCIGGGVFQEVGSPKAALYVEMWDRADELENHVRSPGYDRLLAIMETAPERPALTFNFVAETRGLAWVEELRLGATP
jgi:quinol monooxygenase YgiN